MTASEDDQAARDASAGLDGAAGLDAFMHEAFMREALAEAKRAAADGDVPVGAVVVVGGRIVARGRNRREALDDPTAHAEVEAIREAARGGHGSGWRLVGATVYATLEPCPMCAGALVNARVERVVYGCPDPKAGAIDTLFSIGTDARLNHRFAIARGVLAEACAAELKTFFAARRGRRKV
jgi:tRNA(adenine34) deaminase